MLQTAAQQLTSSQPGFGASTGLASKQLPSQGHSQPELDGTRQMLIARTAQLLSHLTLQHSGSTVQTALQQAASSHIGVALDFSQSPTPGHS